MMTIENEVIARAIAALEDAVKFTNMGFDFDDGDVFGIHSNDAVDALSGYANAINELRALLDKPEAPRKIANAGVTGSGEGQ